jgi:hypothetical protein
MYKVQTANTICKVMVASVIYSIKLLVVECKAARRGGITMTDDCNITAYTNNGRCSYRRLLVLAIFILGVFGAILLVVRDRLHVPKPARFAADSKKYLVEWYHCEPF